MVESYTLTNRMDRELTPTESKALERARYWLEKGFGRKMRELTLNPSNEDKGQIWGIAGAFWIKKEVKE